MKKIILVEYLNYINCDGHAIGHGKKVLSEAARILAPDIDAIICSKEYTPQLCKLNRNKVSFISAIHSNKDILNKKIFLNIKAVFDVVRNKNEIIWFTNTEWRLFAFLSFYSSKSKIVVTCYRDTVYDIKNSNSKFKYLKLFLVKKGIKKVDFVIITNPNLRISDKQIFVPDYVYTDFYKKYQNIKKKDQIICVGAMRASKDLRGVIKHFNGTDIPVYIIGGFADKKEYEWLSEHKGDNIIIEDRIVPYDEYYQLIAESKFVIVPYKMNSYHLATSGILQETIFLKAIPIAPYSLLQYNGIDGIGYTNIEELPNNLNELKCRSKTISQNTDVYEEFNIKRKLIEMFQKL